MKTQFASPEPSRRALLCSFAAAPAVALRSPAAAAVDPVFTAIAAERAAHARWQAAADALDAAEARWEAISAEFPASITINLAGEIDPAGDMSYAISEADRLDAWFDIWERISDPDTAAEFAARRQRARQELAGRKSAWERARARLNLPLLDEAETVAMNAWAAAELDVLATAPTTTPGALKLLEYAADVLKTRAQEPTAFLPTFQAMAAFVRSRALS